ncbi:TetR/AcrR family transcriptional regulator [Fodinicola feengrottensis]|uniref:TetR/AcrR family transcriptional regulator n=1 Tax=Fodinicola feengrottensis TaxID=435914 RepID=A0ABP4VFG1_9ACTN
MNTDAARPRAYGGRRASDRKAERRERLMQAGLELFGTAGYPSSSIEKLCARAGVSTRNFYEEFTGREALLIALYGRILEEAAVAIGVALTDTAQESMRPRVERAIRAYVRTMAEDPRWARLAYVEVIGVSQAVEQFRMGWRNNYVDLLVGEAERAAARGEAPPRDYRLSSLGLIGAINEMVHQWTIADGGIDQEELVAEIVRVAMAVLSN